MRFVVQVVKNASVSVDGKLTGSIERGLLVLAGISGTDTREIADKMVKKLCSLRIFSDENGKTNLSLSDVKGELLIVSQFTLYADCKSGNRPGFSNAGRPDMAEEMYNYIVKKAEEYAGHVGTGVFGAHMQVSLLNDGPFTVILDSEELFGK